MYHCLNCTVNLKLQIPNMNCFWTSSPKHKHNKQANTLTPISFQSTSWMPRKSLFIFEFYWPSLFINHWWNLRPGSTAACFFSFVVLFEIQKPFCNCQYLVTFCSVTFTLTFFSFWCTNILLQCVSSEVRLPSEVVSAKTMGIWASSCCQFPQNIDSLF